MALNDPKPRRPSRAKLQEDEAPKIFDRKFSDLESNDVKNVSVFQSAPVFGSKSVRGRFDSISPSELPTESDKNTNDQSIRDIDPRRGRNCLARHSTLLIVALVFIIAISIGVGVGVTRNRCRHNCGLVQGFGAINGSGIVAIDLGDGSPRITAYTQDWDGSIIKSEYFNNSWTGGGIEDDLNTVNATIDGHSLVARDGTPLMSLVYEHAGERIWHLYYVTEDNYLANWINSNISTGWYPGSLRSGDFRVSSSSHVGLSACVNYQWYGAPANSSGFGIRLYYGTDNDTIQELGWNLDGQSAWFTGHNFGPDSNGRGGVECTVRGLSITYVWLETTNNTLQQMWYEFNTSAATTSHPAEIWVAGLSYAPILLNSAISAINSGTTKNVHFQAPDLSVMEIVANGTAENATWGAPYMVGTEKGINGTRIGSVVLNTGVQNGLEIHVEFQTNWTNMKDYIRAFDSVNWAEKEVPVGN